MGCPMFQTVCRPCCVHWPKHYSGSNQWPKPGWSAETISVILIGWVRSATICAKLCQLYHIVATLATSIRLCRKSLAWVMDRLEILIYEHRLSRKRLSDFSTKYNRSRNFTQYSAVTLRTKFRYGSDTNGTVV